jgi:hypothetical protein
MRALFSVKKKTTTMSLDLLSRITQQELKEHELKKCSSEKNKIVSDNLFMLGASAGKVAWKRI